MTSQEEIYYAKLRPSNARRASVSHPGILLVSGIPSKVLACSVRDKRDKPPKRTLFTLENTLLVTRGEGAGRRGKRLLGPGNLLLPLPLPSLRPCSLSLSLTNKILFKI